MSFAREFAELPATTNQRLPTPDSTSISSASSFQSLPSTLSTKSSSGICADSPTRVSDTSYDKSDISGLDDLIAACAGIHLNTTSETLADQNSFADGTFTSANEDSLVDRTIGTISPGLNYTRDLNVSCDNNKVDSNSINTQTSLQYPVANETILLNSTQNNKSELSIVTSEIPELINNLQSEFKESSPFDASNFGCEKSLNKSETIFETLPNISGDFISSVTAPTFLEQQNHLEKTKSTAEIIREVIKSNEIIVNTDKNNEHLDSTIFLDNLGKENIVDTEKNNEQLDSTIPLDNLSNSDLLGVSEVKSEIAAPEKLTENIFEAPDKGNYVEFLPNRQSTEINSATVDKFEANLEEINTEKESANTISDAYDTFSTDSAVDFEKLKLEAENIAQDIYNISVELVEEPGFTAAPTGLFRESTNFDFLLNKTAGDCGSGTRRLGNDSLYIKFDPLVNANSALPNMLPQGNGAHPPPSEEQNGEKDGGLMPNLGTPKRNPAIAAIDRLLFYSPMSPANQKREEPEKIVSINLICLST